MLYAPFRDADGVARRIHGVPIRGSRSSGASRWLSARVALGRRGPLCEEDGASGPTRLANADADGFSAASSTCLSPRLACCVPDAGRTLRAPTGNAERHVAHVWRE